MRVTVLYGGPSAEREISLISGKGVIDALREMGHEVFPSDISPIDLCGLDRSCDVIFPVLHGAFGESGELQQILEERNIPFVGSGSVASRIGMDKIATKKLWQRAGLPTPPWEVVTRIAPAATLPPPCVVKPIDSGSSLDVRLCHTQIELDLACDEILSRHPDAMVERLIDGPEITVGILEEEPLDPLKIVVKRAFFDYDAKYKDCGTEHHFDLGLPAQVGVRCREIAREAHRIIGCRDLSRVDFMIDRKLEPQLLEINTMPGFTPMSLLPDAARHAGISFGEMVDRLVRRAAGRGAVTGKTELWIASELRAGKPQASRKTA
jgi:D-alanine-D-alanine ligase